MTLRRKHRRALALAILGVRFTSEVRLANVASDHVDRVMDATDGNLSLAAEMLGINRRSLQRRRQRGRR